MATSDQIDNLAANLTHACVIWKITARDGLVWARCETSRPLVFNGVTYYPAEVESTKLLRKYGLEPNSTDMAGVFDDVITLADVEGGRWKKARVRTEIIVDYRDLALGCVDAQEGFSGCVSKIDNYSFKLEFLSNPALLNQEIGELTSPTDRNRTLDDLGVNVAAFTYAATVKSVTDRRKFKVDFVQPEDNWFQYGKALWLTGANSTTPGMEIKSSTTTDNGTRTEIELYLPMRGNVVVNDTLSLVAGYNGTRDQARDKFNAAINGQFEPDAPGINALYTYPQD